MEISAKKEECSCLKKQLDELSKKNQDLAFEKKNLIERFVYKL